MLQSHGGGLKHRQQTTEPVPGAEGVRMETDPGAWSLQIQAEPEAETQQEVPAWFSGVSCHVPGRYAADHRPYRWEVEQGSHERSDSLLSCISRPRNAYMLPSR